MMDGKRELFADSDAVYLQATLPALRTEGYWTGANSPHTERLVSCEDYG